MALPTPERADARGNSGEQAYCFPMTLTQQAFWYLDRVEPRNPAWNIAVRFRVLGELDLSLFQAAVDEMVARQDALRTTFCMGTQPPWEDEPVQLVHVSMPVPVRIDDLTHLASTSMSEREEQLTLFEAQQPFSLVRGPLLRMRLLRLGREEHILLLTVHHIIADGWSIGILSDELVRFYTALRTGTEPRLPSLPIQFADYAVWEQQHQSAGISPANRLYWGRQLRDLPKCVVPSDYPRPHASAHKGRILSVMLPEELADGLALCARKHQSTLFAAALAVLKLLIHRITGESDIYLGTLLSGREQVELEPLVGVFVNTLVLRTCVEPEIPFATLLARTRETVEEALAHQEMPFSQLMTQLRLTPERGCSHFFSINFIFQRDFVRPWQGAGLNVTALPSRSAGSIYDLNFFMVKRADGWRFSCEYDCELYAPRTVQLLLEQFVSALEQVTRDPGVRLCDVYLPSTPEETLESGAWHTSAASPGENPAPTPPTIH